MIRSDRADFGIVIPVLGDTRYIRQCLHSIAHQEGTSRIHIHVQDGGSGDEIRKTVENLSSSLDETAVRITYANEPDSGPAQAINRGFQRIDAAMITWLGSDDILMPGCLETVRTVVSEFPKTEWLTGLRFNISAQGIPIPTYTSEGFFKHPTGYSREALALGLHGSPLNHDLIQQEGTFWSRELWERVGGLDESLKSAFDFDLWCRFAEFSPLLEVVAPLAAFRIRPGQVSEDMSRYTEEVRVIKSRLDKRSESQSSVLMTKTEIAYLDGKLRKWRKLERPYLVIFEGSVSLPVSVAKTLTRARLQLWFRNRSAKKLTPRLVLLAVHKRNQSRQKARREVHDKPGQPG